MRAQLIIGRDDEWAQFVAALPGGDLVQATSWGEAKRSTGMHAAVVAVREGRELLGGAQLIVRGWRGGPGVAYIPAGPVVADPSDRAQVDSVVAAVLDAAARELLVSYVIAQPAEDEVAMALDRHGFRTGAPEVFPSATTRIDTSRPVEEIVAGASRSRRRKLRQGERAGIKVREGSEQDLGDFYGLYRASAARQGFRPLRFETIEAQWAALHPDGQARVWLADANGVPAAGALVTVFGDTATSKLWGWSAEDPRSPVTPVTDLAIVEWCHAEGLRWYDLGGLDGDVTAALRADRCTGAARSAGTAATKLDWGAEVVLRPEARHIGLGPVARAVTGALPRVIDQPVARKALGVLRNGRDTMGGLRDAARRLCASVGVLWWATGADSFVGAV